MKFFTAALAALYAIETVSTQLTILETCKLEEFNVFYDGNNYRVESFCCLLLEMLTGNFWPLIC